MSYLKTAERIGDYLVVTLDSGDIFQVDRNIIFSMSKISAKAESGHGSRFSPLFVKVGYQKNEILCFEFDEKQATLRSLIGDYVITRSNFNKLCLRAAGESFLPNKSGCVNCSK